MPFKAAQLTAPEKADDDLRRLRRATIVEGRQTTLDEELIRIASEAGIDEVLFRRHYTDGSARAAFQEDLEYTYSLGVRGLPVCLIQCGKQSALVSGMIGFNRFVNVIERILGQDEKA